MGSQICDEVRPLLDVEGYTQVGMVQELQIISCGKHKNYLVVELVDRRKVCTPCLDEDVVKLSVRLIEHYSKNTRLVVSR